MSIFISHEPYEDGSSIDIIMSEFHIGQMILASKNVLANQKFKTSYEISKSIDVFCRYIDDIRELKRHFIPEHSFNDLYDGMKCERMINECKIIIYNLQEQAWNEFRKQISVNKRYML